MSILNIYIGLGGTGLEVINDLLKINNRYPFKSNKFEWFALDSASLMEDSDEDSLIYKEEASRFTKLQMIGNARKTIEDFQKDYPESSLKRIFPENDYLVRKSKSSQGGAWRERKLGFLLLLNHILKSDNNTLIFEKIKKKIEGYSLGKGEIEEIHIFIVNSLAGGTGSGLFLPFTAFLRAKISANFENTVPIKYYNFLALHSFVAKGSRGTSDTYVTKIYKANSYEALLELKRTMEDDFSWEIKLNQNSKFTFNSSEVVSDNKIDKITDAAFLFGDKNVNGQNIVIDGISNSEKAYRPYFQEMAWCLYFLGCGDLKYFQNKIGNDLKDFVGMGVLPLEYPEKLIYFAIATDLFYKTHLLLSDKSFDKKNDLGNFGNYPLEYEKYINDCEGFKKEEYKKYYNELSLMKNIEQIKSARWTIKNKETDYYFGTTLKQLDKELKNLFKQHTINNLKDIVSIFKLKIIDEINTLKNEIGFNTVKLEQINKQIQTLKKIPKVRKEQVNYFYTLFDLTTLKEKNKLLENLRSEIENREKYFKDIIQIFDSRVKIEGHRFSFDPYFEFPPSYSDTGYSKEDISMISNKILSKIVSDSENNFNDKENKTIGFLGKIWEGFSKNELNNELVESYKTQIINNDACIEEKLDSAELYSSWLNYIIRYLKDNTSNYISEHNPIFTSFNENSIQSYLKISYPFIPLRANEANRIGDKCIFCNSSSKKKLKGKDTLLGYEKAQRYNTLDVESLLLMSSFVGGKKMKNLELEDLKTSYESLKEGNKKIIARGDTPDMDLNFIDPMFGGYKHDEK